MATIYCFSSTGNSLYAAKRIAKEIGAKVLPMREEYTICEDDRIGLVFPVYFWGLPKMVAQFITQLQISRKDAYIFALITSGGPIPGVIGMLDKALNAQGIRLGFGKRVTFLSNYLPEFSINDSEGKRRKTEANLQNVIKSIKSKETNKTTSFTGINEFVYKIFPDYDCDQYFTVSEKCTGCGTCQKVCPADNIIIKNGSPQFQHHCENCLGCLHHCPSAAIDWKRKTQGKKRYRHNQIALKEIVALNHGRILP